MGNINIYLNKLVDILYVDFEIWSSILENDDDVSMLSIMVAIFRDVGSPDFTGILVFFENFQILEFEGKKGTENTEDGKSPKFCKMMCQK